jgi:hypothetical protein
VLPNATIIARNPSVIVVVASLDGTANATNDFDLCFFLGGFLRFLRSFFLGLGWLVKEIETLRMLSFCRSDGSSRFICRERMSAIFSKVDGRRLLSGTAVRGTLLLLTSHVE